MARQDSTIRYSIEVDGDAGLKKIADGLNEIATSSSDAAPAATALLEQLKSLASQNALATNLVADKAALVDLGNELFLAKQKAADLQAAFTATAAPTAAMSRALEKANASVASLETQYNVLSATILKGSNALAAAGIDAENLDAAQRGLQSSIAGVRAEAAGLATSFDAANAAGQREALTMGEIADRSAVLKAGFEQLKGLLLTFGSILAFEKIKTDIGEVLDTGDKFEKWGQQFSAAFGGAAQGEEALEKVKAIADETPLSLDDVTKAALQAKKEGLDPFNGSLKTLIDATVKFGGGSEQLDTLITALGKSANQGGLNIRTLTTLEQQGIPAAQLLGAAIGKSAAQVTELAKQGKLGADSVNELIDALGKDATGGLADQFNLLSTQVTKAHDNYDDFLKLIAQSGVYQFVVDQLKALNAEFKAGLESGSLQASAKAISDGLIALGQSLLSVTKFAIDHAGAIKDVVEAYAVYKATMLGLDLIGAARNFITLATSTRVVAAATTEAAVAAGSYATAMKAADAAALAASAESSGLGKLVIAIGKIPRNVQIGLAVAGADFAITETLKVVDTLTKITELQNQQAQQQKDDAALSAQINEQAAAILAEKINAAKTDIATTDELAAKNRQQSADYIDALQDAVRYYTALSIQDKQLGDNDGAKAAGNRITEYSSALQDAIKHQQDLTTDLPKMAAAVELVVDKFIDFKTKGESSAAAVEGAFNKIEIATPTGLQEAVDIIKDITPLAKDGGEAIQSELVLALKKLDATDLSSVEDSITKLFDDGKISAQTFQTVMKAAVQASLLNVGATAQQVGTQFDAAGQKIIASFTGVATSAQSTGQQIQFAFAKALSQTTTEGEVNALKEQLQAAFNAGRIGADQFTAGMQAAGRKIAEIQTAAIESGAALDGMGTQGVTAAQRISNALQDARDKLVVQADQIAAAIAKALNVDANADVGDLKAQLAGVEAQISDYNTKIAKASDTGTTGLKQTTAAAKDTSDAVEDTAKAAEKASDSFSDLSADGGDSLGQLDNALQNTRQKLLDVSTAAAAAFDSKLPADFFDAFDSTGIGFAKVIEGMNEASASVNQTIADQRTQLQGEIADINNLGAAGSSNFGQFGNSASAAAAKMTSLAQLIASGNYDAGLLGQQELQPLQAALEAAAQRAQQLVDQVKQANDAFNQLAADTQDALDEQEGNQEAIEDRRHQKELDDLQDAAKAANQLNSQTYLQAVANENKLHALKMANIATQQAAQSGSNGNGSASATSKSNGGIGSGGGATDSSGNAGLGGAGFGAVTFNIRIDTAIGSDLSKVGEQIGPAVLKYMRNLQAKTTGPILTGR